MNKTISAGAALLIAFVYDAETSKFPLLRGDLTAKAGQAHQASDADNARRGV
jgi:hypothetical protein